MLLHIRCQAAFQGACRPVRRSDGQTNERIRKDTLRPRKICTNEFLHLGRHPLNRRLDRHTLNGICPRCEMDLHLCTCTGADRNPRHGVADEQSIKDRTDDLRFLRCRDIRRMPPLHALRRNRCHGTLHAFADNGGDRLIAHDNSRSFLHAGGLCGICGGRKPPSDKKCSQKKRQTHRA